MNITRENFNATFPAIAKAIEESNFLSFDGEFTGLTNKTFSLSLFDTPKERYQKLCYNTDGFLLLQFGLATFCWKENENKYEVKAFNFYIFPHTSPCFNSPDRIFSCQSSCLEFLRNQDLDFNLLFKEGISYLRQNEEAALRAAMQEKQAQRQVAKKNEGANFSIIDDEKTKQFVENTCKSIQEFLEETEQTELLLEPCNSYLRKVLYEVLPVKFPNQISVDLHINEITQQRQVAVTRGDDKLIKKEKRERLRLQEETHFEDAVGFSKIIKLLSDSKKLLVGHNMLLDLVFTINQFVTPLPSTLLEFKSVLSSMFPQIVDTKLMASLLPFKEFISSTSLSDLYNTLQNKPFNPPLLEVPAQYVVDGSHKVKFHEAAYDAYITGFSFLTMLHYLPLIQKSNSICCSTPQLQLIAPFINKIFFLKSFDIPYINIAGSDLTPDRDHVFHVTFPSNWKANDLRQLFSSFGQIVISWICETECFVGLHDKLQAKNVKTMLKKESPEPSGYSIMSFTEYNSSKSLTSQLYSSPSKYFKQTPQKLCITTCSPQMQASPRSPLTTFSTIKSSNRKRNIKTCDASVSSSSALNNFEQPEEKKTKLQSLEVSQEIEKSSIDKSDQTLADHQLLSQNASKTTPLFDVPNEW